MATRTKRNGTTRRARRHAAERRFAEGHVALSRIVPVAGVVPVLPAIPEIPSGLGLVAEYELYRLRQEVRPMTRDDYLEALRQLPIVNPTVAQFHACVPYLRPEMVRSYIEPTAVEYTDDAGHAAHYNAIVLPAVPTAVECQTQNLLPRFPLRVSYLRDSRTLDLCPPWEDIDDIPAFDNGRTMTCDYASAAARYARTHWKDALIATTAIRDAVFFALVDDVIAVAGNYVETVGPGTLAARLRVPYADAIQQATRDHSMPQSQFGHLIDELTTCPVQAVEWFASLYAHGGSRAVCGDWQPRIVHICGTCGFALTGQTCATCGRRFSAFAESLIAMGGRPAWPGPVPDVVADLFVDDDGAPLLDWTSDQRRSVISASILRTLTDQLLTQLNSRRDELLAQVADPIMRAKIDALVPPTTVRRDIALEGGLGITARRRRAVTLRD